MTDINEFFSLIPPAARTFLDVGAGSGYAGMILKQDSPLGNKGARVSAIEAWVPLFKILPPAYDATYEGDAEEVLSGMVDRGAMYDVVLCSHVLEHMDKDKALRVLKLMERVARMRIIVASPNRFHTNDIKDWGNNPLQQHKCLLTSGEARREFGYRVKGSGRLFSFGVGLAKRLLCRFFPDWIGYKDTHQGGI